MSNPDMVGWFDARWMPLREQALKTGWDSLSRFDQVLVAVGFLLDSCIGDGVWAVVDGVVEGNDEGLTRKMPDALDAIGMPEAAEHVRNIIRLRTPTGLTERNKANRDEALAHWLKIDELFDQWVPDGQRVMLTNLYNWYHSQTQGGPFTPVEPQRNKGKVERPKEVTEPEEVHRAVQKQDIASLRALIANGADMNSRNSLGSAPLHSAVSMKMKNAEILKLLIASGADVNSRDDKFGNTPLHHSTGIITTLLLENGADVTVINERGWLALHAAAYWGRTESVKSLLAHGADPDARDRDGKRPIDLAIERRHSDVANLLRSVTNHG